MIYILVLLVVLVWLLLDIKLIEIKIIYRLVGIKDNKVIMVEMGELMEKMVINMININIIINHNKEIEE